MTPTVASIHHINKLFFLYIFISISSNGLLRSSTGDSKINTIAENTIEK